MGYEILYCRTCQSQVRGADLEKGTAQRIDGNAYCPACAKSLPKTVPTPPGTRRAPARRGSTDRIPIPPSSSTHHAVPPRRAAPASAVPLILGASAAGIGLLILLGLAFSGGKPAPSSTSSVPTPPPAPLPAPRPAPPPPRPPPPPIGSSPADVLAALEKAVAEGAEPNDILLRIDQARKQLAGTPEAARLGAIEERAVQLKREFERKRQIDSALDQIRKMRTEDPRYRRRSDVLALLDSVLKIAGTRAAEVEAARVDYLKDADAYAAEFSGLAAWYPFDSADSLATDESPAQRNGTSAAVWQAEDGPRRGVLLLQGNGELVLPVAVREDFTIAFWMKTRQTAPVQDQWWKGVGVVDAECDGMVADFGTGLIGTRLAFGIGGMPDTTILSKTEVVDGAWRHVAVTYRVGDGGMKLYLNGALETEGRGASGTRSIPERILVGRLQTGPGRFQGSLDDLRFFARVLSDVEIRTLLRR